jgi:hypothetical protein
VTDQGIAYLPGQGGLTVGVFNLTRPGGGAFVAWTILDHSPLWGFPSMRGESTLYPQVEGRAANPRYVDETVYRLPFHITGALDPTGSPYANPVMGLALNLDYLWEHVIQPDVDTRTADLEMPDGTFRSGEVQLNLVVGDLLGSYDKPAELFVTVHAGMLAEVGS